MSNDIEDLSDRINHTDLNDIYRRLQPQSTDNIFKCTWNYHQDRLYARP